MKRLIPQIFIIIITDLLTLCLRVIILPLNHLTRLYMTLYDSRVPFNDCVFRTVSGKRFSIWNNSRSTSLQNPLFRFPEHPTVDFQGHHNGALPLLGSPRNTRWPTQNRTASDVCCYRFRSPRSLYFVLSSVFRRLSQHRGVNLLCKNYLRIPTLRPEAKQAAPRKLQLTLLTINFTLRLVPFRILGHFSCDQ